MKFYITGSSRGLGNFLEKEFNCISFNRPYDIEKDIDEIVSQIEPGSVVILNAYANGSQLAYLRKLYNKNRIIVSGSIASTLHDRTMLDYSYDKQELEYTFQKMAVSSKLPMLYLKLTSSSYKDYNTIAKTIRFWLDTPSFIFAGFNIT